MATKKVEAEVSGTVWKILVAEGDQVAADQEIMILESMKMEIPVNAPAAGRVAEIRFAEADTISEGDVLATIEV